MWEICKNRSASEQEVDRTIQYIRDTILELQKLETKQSEIISVGGVSAQVRRSPLGVVLCVAPFNYPFNETYTTLIPALIMGNVVILKTPRTGGLCHYPTLELFKECFPAGVVNVIHGSGRETLPAMMKTGLIDVLAFIGTHNAANSLINSHPNLFKLRNVLGLDAKNAAFVLPEADIDVAVAECALGAYSFNGQRCTALKVLFVHESIVDEFVAKFSKAIDNLKMGYPWESGVSITPLAEPQKPSVLRDLIKDAVEKGAKIVNERGIQFSQDQETNLEKRIDRGCSALFAPTALYPVTADMKVYHEEQFGPITPIVKYSTVQELEDYITQTSFGQQASVFIKTESGVAVNSEYFVPLVDLLTHHVSRININCQCVKRGPDSYPFTGRKNSAVGTLSVYDALRAMSIRALVATKESGKNVQMLQEIRESGKSQFIREFPSKK
ncbi:hypothetical protein C9374_006300 [Naegleria lovaniensis]|uniref:Succinate-semialdehyde dehydrogenase, mitochondrial n=1 Tax=Naegleria lovaniensis TaxID=51637 RepID=A0AA88GLI0_NAELO|nr:uncharacterized protein C9374_006300 [Naegleria lovaniensis]KAG2381311.1 hypothetical protein C9374_006300 [Naegleria lovaniensis]